MKLLGISLPGQTVRVDDGAGPAGGGDKACGGGGQLLGGPQLRHSPALPCSPAHEGNTNLFVLYRMPS